MSDQNLDLCGLCTKLNIVDLIHGLGAYQTKSITHYSSYRALVGAADAGCNLCSIFRATLTIGHHHNISHVSGTTHSLHHVKSSLSTRSEPTTLTEAESWHEGLDKHKSCAGYILEVQAESTLDTDFEIQYTMQLSRKYKLGQSEETVRSRSLLISNDFDLGLGIRNRGISKFPSFTTYSQWIRSCAHEAKHLRCPSAEPVELPSRVIDVGGGSGSELPKLIETKGMKGLYTTLSHCWGKTQPLKTTLGNFTTHTHGISFKNLPKQFQDAATITKILGYRYLWIDSLCIVQDDKRDWATECFRMGDIYRQSVCTLAAPVASDSEHGLLNERPPPSVPPCKVRAVKAGELIGYLSIGLPPGDFKERSSPLASRAWVLQEQLMSPRTLYFGPRGMYFQCNSHELLETYHYPLPPERLTPWRTGGASDMPKTIITMTMHDDIIYWYAIVRQYCFRFLTKGEDKLPALSGLAKVISERTNDNTESPFGKYLAGLWLNDLGRGLLWVSASPYDPKEILHEADDLAPTWSWASQNQAVEWKVLKEFRPQFECLSSSVGLKSLNIFGQVTEGVLELKSKSVDCVLRRNPGSKPVLLCTTEHDAREAAEMVLDASTHHELEKSRKANKQIIHCRLLLLGFAESSLFGRRWYALLLCSKKASQYVRLGIANSLGVGLAHARSLTTEQSFQWLDHAKEERVWVV